MFILQVLLGDSYGEQNLVPEMTTEDFSTLSSIINDKDQQNKELLAGHYKRDDNALPPVFLLQVSI